MSDQYVEVTRRGWGSRVIGSIGGAIFGFVLFIVAFPVLWWNEGRAVRTYESLQEGAGVVVAVAADRVDATNEGKLVHLSGTATTKEVLVDPVFKVSANALRLRRDAEMYQWVQRTSSETREKLGGSEETVTTYSYDTEWKSSVVNSSSFKQPQGHRNPGSMRYPGASFSAGTVTLGAFTLSAALRDDIDNYEPVAVTEATLAALAGGPAADETAEAAPPARKSKTSKKAGKKAGKRQPRAVAAATTASAQPFKLSGDGLYLGKDPASPAVGDTRISFRRVPPTDVSVIAQQSGNTFRPYQTKAGKALQMLDEGTVSAAQMFTAAEQRNVLFTWLFRAGGFLLMLMGVSGMLRPLSVTVSVVPFLASILRFGLGLVAFAVAAPLSLLTIAIAWISHRPLLGILLLVAAVGAIVGVKMIFSRKKAAAAAGMPAIAQSA